MTQHDSRIVRGGALALWLFVDTTAGDVCAIAGVALAVALTLAVGTRNPMIDS